MSNIGKSATQGKRAFILYSKKPSKSGEKSTLLALCLHLFFPMVIPLILSAKTFAKIIMHLTA